MAGPLEDQQRVSAALADIVDGVFGPEPTEPVGLASPPATTTTSTTTSSVTPSSVADFTSLFGEVPGAEGEDLSAAAGPVGNPFDRLLAGEPVDDAELVAPPPPVFDPVSASVRNFASGALHLGRLAASGENRIELFQSFARNGPIGPLGDGLLALMGREPDPDKVDLAVKADLEQLIPVLDKLAKDLHTPGNFLTEKVMQGLGSLVGAPVMLQALNQEAFEEAKARGMTDAEATRRGNLNMIIGGAMEMIGLHGMFRARGVFKALARVKDPFVRKTFVAGLAITEAAGREGLTETGQQTLLEVMALYDGTDDSLADMAKRIVESGLIGFAVGGIGGGVFGGIGLIESELMQVDADAAHTAEVLRIEMQKQVLLKQIEESRAREQAKITPPEEGDIEAVMAELFTAPRRTAPAERPAPTTQRDDGTHSKLPKFIPEMDIPNGLRDRGDGDRYFEPDDLARLRGIRHKDREVLVYMSPDDFLALAPPIAQAGEQKGGEPALDKIFKIGERIGSGEPLADIPFLLGETKDGLFKVSGHEGRHRALMLRAAGVTQMPVRITDANIRWSEQTDPKNRDFTEDFPTVMEGQLGNFPQETHAPKGQGGVNFRTFPFTREDIVTPIVADADEMPLTPDEENALSEDVGFDPADFLGVQVSDVAPRNVSGLPKSALTPAQQRVVAQLVVDENVELPEASLTELSSATTEVRIGEDTYRVTQSQKGRRINYKLFKLEEAPLGPRALTDTQFDVLASVSSAAIEAQTAEDGSARIVVTPAERAGLAELGIEPTKNGTFTGEQIDTLLQLRDAANRRPARIKTTVTALGPRALTERQTRLAEIVRETANDSTKQVLRALDNIDFPETKQRAIDAIHGTGEFADASRPERLRAIVPHTGDGQVAVFLPSRAGVPGLRVVLRNVKLDDLQDAFPLPGPAKRAFPTQDLLGQTFNLKEAVRMAQLTSAVGVTPKPFDPRTIRKLSDQGLVTAVEGKVRLTELGKRTADNFRRDSRGNTLEERTGFDREIEERRGLQRGDRVVLDELTEAVYLRGETTVGDTRTAQETAVIRQLTPEGVADSVVRLQRIRRAFEEDYRPDGVFAQTGGFSPDEIVALAENLADAYDVTGFTPGEPPPPMDYHPPTGPTVPGSPPPPTIQGRFDLLQADGNGGTDVAATPPGGQFPPTTPPPPGGRGPYRQWPPPPPPGGRKPLEHIIPFTTFDVAEWRTWDAFVANFQNRMIRLRQFQETIRETVPNRAATGKKKTEGTIPIRQVGFGLREEMDTYLHETLFPGKSTERMEAFENELVFPAMRQMTQEGVSLESMGEFMFARHAPERNRKLRFVAGEKQLIEEKAAIETEIVTLTSEGQRILRQADEIQSTEQGPFDRRAQASAKAAVMRLRMKAEKILAKRKKLQKQAADLQVRIDTEFPDGMSGMTDPEAQNIITRHRVAGTYEVHEKWRLFWKERVIDERLSMIEEEKLETPQFVQALRDAFEDDTYVPLYVVDEEITTRQKNIGAGPVSRGYTVPGREARRLKGGNVKNRYNPLAAIIMDFERTITRSEKTRVLRSFAKMVRANRNDATWIIRRPEPRDGQVVEPSNVIDPDTAPASAQGSFIPGFGDIGRADKTEGIKGFREGDEIILPDGRRIDATTVWFDQATGEPFGWHPSLDLSGDNVVVFADTDGVKISIEILDPELLKAMKNLGGGGRMWTGMLMLNNLFRSVTTTWSPTFVLRNLIRDVSQGLVFIAGEDSFQAARIVAAGINPARKGIKRNAWEKIRKKGAIFDELYPVQRAEPPTGTAVATVDGRPLVGTALARTPGREVSTDTTGRHTATEKDIPLPDDWEAWDRDFLREGGKSGFFTLDVNTNDRIRLFQRSIARYNNSKNWRDARDMFTWLNDVMLTANESVEMAIRLSYYKYLVEHGVSRKRAAFEGKELTINFDRKGYLTWFTNQMWVFSNPALQGTVRTIQSTFTRPGAASTRKWVYGVMTVAGIINVMNKLVGGDDWDRLVATQPWLFDKNLVVMLPMGGYIAVPLPYGFSTFKSAADVMYWWADRRMSFTDGVKHMINSMDESFIPLQGPGGLDFAGAAQRVSPTFTDPFLQLALNQDWLGRPILPLANKFAPARSDSSRYFQAQTLPESITRDATAWANRLTGGTSRVSGGIDISPETVDQMLQHYGGGAYRFLGSLASLPWKAGRVMLGEENVEFGVKDLPIIGSITGTLGDRWPWRVIFGPLWQDAGRKQLSVSDRRSYYEAIGKAAKIDDADERISRQLALQKINTFVSEQAKVEVSIATNGRELREAKEKRLVESEKARLKTDQEYKRAIRLINEFTE